MYILVILGVCVAAADHQDEQGKTRLAQEPLGLSWCHTNWKHRMITNQDCHNVVSY